MTTGIGQWPISCNKRSSPGNMCRYQWRVPRFLRMKNGSNRKTRFLKSQLLKPFHGFLGIFTAAEGGETEKALSAGTETGTGSPDNLDFI
jgi:hypothetical protein